jgi:arylsulfatase A-like enzyme
VEQETIAVWLQRAGYYTAHVGKYLNGWGNPAPPDMFKGGVGPPPGWSHWFGLIDPSTYAYYDYKVSDDGNVRTFGKAPADYQTDVLGAEVVRTIDRAAEANQPFFVSFMPLAPHIGASENSLQSDKPLATGLAVPAPRHEGAFAHEPLPRTPTMMSAGRALQTDDLKNKPEYVRFRVANYGSTENYAIRAYRAELESLQAVDEWVERIYNSLRDRGVLDNTLMVFASDNGLFHGEHGLMQKNLLYEEAAHVPLVIRGPGFPAGATAAQPASNVDLAPTILTAAGLVPPDDLDGRDLAPLASDPTLGIGRALLFEDFFAVVGEEVHAVRVDRWKYSEWNNGRELYDLQTDPYEMRNLANEPAYRPTIDALKARLDQLRACSGRTCEDSDASRR